MTTVEINCLKHKVGLKTIYFQIQIFVDNSITVWHSEKMIKKSFCLSVREDNIFSPEDFIWINGYRNILR